MMQRRPDAIGRQRGARGDGMIQLSVFSLLALLEILAVLLLLLAFVYWRLRAARRRSRIQFIDATDQHPTPALYLDGEAARTRTFVNDLRGKPKAEPTAPELRAALAARAGLLRYESDLARHPVGERDANAWVTLARNVDAKLTAEGFTAQWPQVSPVYGEDTGTSQAMIAQQTRTIEHLRQYIQQLLQSLGHQPMPDDGILKHMDELERANRELNQCVQVLEDENSFLRDQIAALLKIGTAHSAGAGDPVKP